ncbi:MAG: glycosyltransferase, partial [Candidatus Marinimicrobia bacterium]|nr:glycosyltransferase [Candidatus Neomarinimicrobiota bacterium]
MKSNIVIDNRKFSSQKLSLIICTRNRAKSLEKCLYAINVDSLKSVKGELIIVDNGSVDDTQSVLDTFLNGVDIDCAVLYEPRPGLSRARNTGLECSSGNTIVFTDDDCYLDEDYINIANEIFENKPFAYCGGPILLYDKTDARYGIMEQDYFELIPPHSFLYPGKFQGANLIINREIYEKIGGFDQELGAGTPFRCEDID